MHIVTRIGFFFSLFVVALCSFIPMIDRAMSWDEGAIGIFLGLFFAAVWAGLLLVFLPPRVKGDRYESAIARRKIAMIYGAIGTMFCVVFGTTVASVCHSRVEAAVERQASQLARSSKYGTYSGYGSGGYDYGGFGQGDNTGWSTYKPYYASSSFSDPLSLARERQDRHGRDYGFMILLTALVPLMSGVVFAALKPNGWSSNRSAYGVAWPNGYQQSHAHVASMYASPWGAQHAPPPHWPAQPTSWGGHATPPQTFAHAQHPSAPPTYPIAPAPLYPPTGQRGYPPYGHGGNRSGGGAT